MTCTPRRSNSSKISRVAGFRGKRSAVLSDGRSSNASIFSTGRRCLPVGEILDIEHSFLAAPEIPGERIDRRGAVEFDPFDGRKLYVAQRIAGQIVQCFGDELVAILLQIDTPPQNMARKLLRRAEIKRLGAEERCRFAFKRKILPPTKSYGYATHNLRLGI